MKKDRSLKQRLIAAGLTLVMLVSSLLGATFAWFTDSVTSAGNTIQAGNLKVDLSHRVNGAWVSLKQNPDHLVFNYDKWEPGYTRVETLKIDNLGSLALQYRLSLEVEYGTAKLGKNGENLADMIEVYIADGERAVTDYEAIKSSWTYKGTLSEVMKNPSVFFSGQLLPAGKVLDSSAVSTTAVASKTVSIALHMQKTAGNEYQNLSVGNIYVNLVAAQWGYENDSFNNSYDKDTIFPEINIGGITVDVTTQNNVVTEEATVNGIGVTAKIPAGVTVQDGVNKLGLSVTEKNESDANLTLNDGEALRSLDVHMDGVADNNTVPMLITIEKAMKVGLNIGNYTLYHVEDGVSNAMTAVNDPSELDAHNEFYYDPATGDVTLAMATFSEVAMVAEIDNAWKGTIGTAFNGGTGTEKDPYIVANADQLAYFGAAVGGMVENENGNAFEGEYIKLIADINLGYGSDNYTIFYPIGYYNSEGTYGKTGTAITSGLRVFSGTFDGNGHTIENFYHNTWEMKGDNEYYAASEQCYRDGMGLFGKVYKGTVKNLTVKNFTSDGEYTTTGVIAAYSDGATFENIAIFDCNPRVYNIGNGGIVGCVGWYAKEANLKTTFTNITVDNSNKISALWGSYDVACGGIVGQYYPTSGQTSANKPANGGVHFENCHVSAIMDVYNDVCANYQYYAYRYTGMLIGSVRENETVDGHSYPKMDGITASGCTVHFGTWNDYYYCEIIDNTTASYTHDYQMSRLTEIKEINGTTITYLDGSTGTVPASGRANYVIVDYTKGHGTDNATCYHFKDGEVWTHDMGGIQEGVDENGDGQDDLKEDKQHIYLEFNNLVTGYGWGVTSKGVGDLAGVTILDREEGNSVEKFQKLNELPSITTGDKISIGDLFAEATISDPKLSIVGDKVQVTVSPKIGTNSTVSAVYTPDTNDWTQGTLTFSGFGTAIISITDYYFCKTTTLEIEINDLPNVEKFETKFTDDFLYRVGNAVKSTVALGTLFTGNNVTNGNVEVEIKTVAGNASGSFTADSTDWTKASIQFTGTGVVKVTITDNDHCTPTELILEVVDAVNVTTATSATKNNVVLLNDARFGSLEVSGGYTLYGNGFTLTCSSDSAALDFGYAFVNLDDGILDNVQIVTPNYDYAALYKSNLTSRDNRSETTDKTRYYNAKSAVTVSGNSQILNSRISGARAAVNVAGGNVVIDNSRIEGGAVANILVSAANSLTLRDVTLIQKPTASTYDSSKSLMGFSVLYMCDPDGKATPTTIEGTFVQQAWVNADDKQYVPSNAQDIVDGVMKETAFIHNINGKDSLNLGFAYMPPEDVSSSVEAPDNIADNRTDKATIPYEMKDVSIQISILSTTVYVYSYKNTNGTADSFKTESQYTPNKYGDIITVDYSDSADGLESNKSFGTNGWVYELNVDLDKLSGYELDFSKLSMSVNGVPVTDFKVDGNAKPTSPVAVTAGGTTYTLTATVNGKECTTYLKVTGTETSKESPSKISGPTTAGFGVAKSYGSDWSGAADVLTGVKIKYWSVAENKYIEYDFSDFTVPGNAGKLNGTNSYWEYTHTNNDFTLKVTNTVAIHSGKSVYGMPIRGTDGKLFLLRMVT